MVEIALTVDWQLRVDQATLFPAAAAAGFTAVSLDQAAVTPATSEALQAHGLRCHELLGVGFFEDDERTDRSAEAAARAAEAVGAAWVLAYLPHYGPRTFDQVARLTELLAPTGTRLAIEFTAVRRPDRIGDVRPLLARARPGSAGLVIDTWHLAFGHPESWGDLVTLPLDEIAYVQFADHSLLDEADRIDQTANHRQWPGRGQIDLARFVDILRGRGWSGTVSTEVLNAAYRELPIDEYCRSAYDSTAPFWRPRP